MSDLIDVATNEIRYTEADKSALQALLLGASRFEPNARKQLERFIEKTPTRIDIADPTVMTADATRLLWSPATDASLYVDGVSYDDVTQGAAGDCYLISAMTALAATDAKVITDAITDNKDGTYSVRFFDQAADGTFSPVSIRVDDDLAKWYGTPRYAEGRNPKELWGALIEKAYATWKGGYDAIGHGGLSSDVFAALTGKPAAYFISEGAKPTELAAKLKGWLETGHAVTVSTGKQLPADAPKTLVATHAYTLLSVKETNGEYTLHVRNPWGTSDRLGQPTPDKGEFDLSLSEYAKYFVQGFVSDLADAR